MTTVSYRDFTGSAAEAYERDFVPAIATPVSSPLLAAAGVRAGERVLDVACGTGLVARLAAERGATVTGLDVAPDMIDIARGVAPSIDWHVGDATSLPFDDASFDLVTCQMGLMFMPDRAAAVAEMRRVLAPGGRVAISTPGAIQPPFALMEQAIVDHISADLGMFVAAVFSMHDADAVAALVRDAGFADVSAEVTTVTLRLPDPATFLWMYVNLTPMAPFVAAAPDEAKAAMERQVVETWQPFVVDGGTPVPQPMVIVTGRR
jgi:ubiquinone/menaquinone biosynthesis C-methylase UbiE